MSLLTFANIPMDEALQKLTAYLTLPTESEAIVRVLESFAKYYAASQSIFGSDGNGWDANTAFFLAYTCLQLNTSWHNACSNYKYAFI
jgi:Sec7-like guanine-nucleotide exchange factor